jgi:hypothetical protein
MKNQPWEVCQSLILNIVFINKRDSSVSKVTVYVINDQDSIPGRAKDFSLFHRVQTGFKTHPVCYSMGTEGSFPGAELAEA